MPTVFSLQSDKASVYYAFTNSSWWRFKLLRTSNWVYRVNTQFYRSHWCLLMPLLWALVNEFYKLSQAKLGSAPLSLSGDSKSWKCPWNLFQNFSSRNKVSKLKGLFSFYLKCSFSTTILHLNTLTDNTSTIITRTSLSMQEEAAFLVN